MKYKILYLPENVWITNGKGEKSTNFLSAGKLTFRDVAIFRANLNVSVRQDYIVIPFDYSRLNTDDFELET